MKNKSALAKTFGTACFALVVSACAASNQNQNLKWKTVLDGGCVAGSSASSMPVINNGLIYIGSSDGAVYAVGASTGEQKWRFQTGAGLPGGTEIIISPDRGSAADMLGSGLEAAEKSKVRGKSQISATPVISDNTVFIGSWDHSFYALDAMTGAPKWIFSAGLPIMEKAIAHAGKIIFVTGGRQSQNDRGDGLVYALDSSTGNSAWIFDTLPDVEAKAKWPSHLPVVRDGVAYVTNWHATRFVEGTHDTATVYAYAVDSTTGEVQWSFRTKAAWPSPPVVTDRYVLFTTSSRETENSVNLHVLDRSTGQEKWIYKTTGGKNFWKMDTVEAPPVANGNIVILTTDTTILGIDIDTGKERWRLVEPFQKAPINKAYLGPLLYILTGDTLQPTVGTFYGIDPANGATVWTMPMYSRNTIRTVIDDVIYIKTAILRNALITVDGHSGKELGTAWTLGLGMFTNESSSICSGPVRSGDQLVVSTALQEFAGDRPSRGYLYSVAAPTRQPK